MALFLTGNLGVLQIKSFVLYFIVIHRFHKVKIRGYGSVNLQLRTQPQRDSDRMRLHQLQNLVMLTTCIRKL